MTTEIRIATASDLERMLAVDARNFAYEPEPGDLERVASVIDVDRFLVAVDGPDLVGIAGTFEKTLTLPGLARVPMAGVTWVSVLASHRRQGLLTGMMRGLDEQAVARHEPILGLLASEAAIYERFGYGVSTVARAIEIDRRRTQLRDEFRPEPGSVRLIDPRDHVDELVAIFDRYQASRPGEVSRDAASFREQHFGSKKPKYGAVHADGFAIWRVESDWAHGHPNHRLIVDDLIGASDEAHVALWHTILSVDLVGPITGWNVLAPNDPLSYLLTDPRAVRTTDVNDQLWLKVADAVACFEARPLGTDDEFVLRIVDRQAVAPGERPAGSAETLVVGSNRAEPTDAEPDIVLTRSAAGPLLLGGVAASTLARGRRLTAEPDVLARADRAFTIHPAPDCRTPF